MRKIILTVLTFSILFVLMTTTANAFIEQVISQPTCTTTATLGVAVNTVGQSFIFNASPGRTCLSTIQFNFINQTTAPLPAGASVFARLHYGEAATNATVFQVTNVTQYFLQASTASSCALSQTRNITVNWCGLNTTGNNNYSITFEVQGEGGTYEWRSVFANTNPYANGKEYDGAFQAANDWTFGVNASAPYFNITAKDAITGASLTTFTATLNGTSFFTTNGTVVTNWTTDMGLANLTVNATNYFSNSTLNYNLTNNNVVMNTTQYTAIYAVFPYSGLQLSNFSLNYTNSTGTFSTSTTSGVVYLPIYNAAWNLTIGSINHNGQNYVSLSNQSNATLTASLYLRNYTFYAFTLNSYNFTFRDEVNGSILYAANTSDYETVELIGSLVSYNFTANGSLYVDLLTPQDYVIRYSKPGHGQLRQYLITLTNRTSTNMSLYLLSSTVSSALTITVYDDLTLNRVPNAVVYLQRFNVSCNCFNTVAMYVTDVGGNGYFDVTQQSELYKFVVDAPWGTTLFTSEPNYIAADTLNLYISNTTDYAESFFNNSGIIWNIYYTNNSGDLQLSVQYNDPNAISSQYCFAVKTYSRYSKTIINSSCSSSSSGTITLGGLSEGETNYGLFTANVGGNNVTLGTGWKEIALGELGAGALGIFLTLGVFLTFTFLAQYHMFALILGSLSLAFSKILGIFPLEWPYIILMIMASIILALFIDKR